MNIGDRIKKIRGKASQTDFGTRLGKSRNTIMRYETNKRTPDSDFLLSLYNNLGIDPKWVLTGEGPMHKGETEHSIPTPDKHKLPWNADIQDLLIRLSQEFAGYQKKAMAAHDEEPLQYCPDDNLGLGESVELLAKIYNSGNQVLIRAIAANLHAFSEAIDNKELSMQAVETMSKMNDRILQLEKRIEELESAPKKAVNG
jgi:transcriptional regulator with XRE-family HTH domain